MFKQLWVKLPLYGLLLGAAISELNADEHHNGHSQQAHVHGVAEMTIVAVEEQLEMELVSPAANIIGFEYKPTTAEERAAISAARSILERHQNVVNFDGARCTLVELDIQMPHEKNNGHGHHHQHDDEHQQHKKYSHDKQSTGTAISHAHGHHSHGHDHRGEQEHHGDDHAHKAHSAEQHEHGIHSEVTARYSFKCTPITPGVMSIEVFDHFPGIETLSTQWISASGQGAKPLSTKERQIDLR